MLPIGDNARFSLLRHHLPVSIYYLSYNPAYSVTQISSTSANPNAYTSHK
jgi:hypothetical protein